MRDMLMTEEEAREKWCPMARTFHVSKEGPQLGPFNRFLIEERPMRLHKEVKCIASDCMMWRQVDGNPMNPSTMGKTFGYCGLAWSCHD